MCLVGQIYEVVVVRTDRQLSSVVHTQDRYKCFVLDQNALANYLLIYKSTAV